MVRMKARVPSAFAVLASLAMLCVLNGGALAAPRALDAPECVVPAKAGGGFDLTCRLVEELVAASGVAKAPMAVKYVPGGIGALAYGRAVTGRLGNPDALIAFSGGSLLNLVQGKFGAYDSTDVRWVAALGTDYGAIVVHKDSKLRNLKDLFAVIRRDFRHVVFGAGGSLGSQDWVKAALIARAAGQDHKAMRFVSFEGGGEAIAALKGNYVTVFCGDAAEAFQAMDAGAPIRVLAILSERRMVGQRASIPTAVEQGYDLVWPVIRGVYAAKLMKDSDYRQWVEFFDSALANPAMGDLREKYNLAPFAMTGAALSRYVEDRARAYREIATELGLKAPPHTAGTAERR